MNLGIVGGGPAGLMAAEVAVKAGLKITLFEGKPTRDELILEHFLIYLSFFLSCGRSGG